MNHILVQNPPCTRCNYISTREILIDILIAGIDTWINETSFPIEQKFPQASVHSLLTQQDSSIGWYQVFFGRFGTVDLNNTNPYLSLRCII
jgi:hypothetical protein